MTEPYPISISICLQAVVQATGVPRDQILGDRRSQAISRARMMACWVARQATPHSTGRIAAVIGGIDHTSVMHAIRRIEQLRETVPFVKTASDKALRQAMADPRQVELASAS